VPGREKKEETGAPQFPLRACAPLITLGPFTRPHLLMFYHLPVVSPLKPSLYYMELWGTLIQTITYNYYLKQDDSSSKD
jgi:hypothetical protein